MKYIKLTYFIYIFQITNCFNIFSYVPNTLHGVVYKYFGKDVSEKSLPVCESKNTVCNVVHRRFWLPLVATRLCKCPSGFDCPWQWKEPLDSCSMGLDNRSQLKFCEPINNLQKCKIKKNAATVRFHKIGEQHIPRPPGITVSCYCPSPAYWKHVRRLEQTIGINATIQVTDTYECARLKHCRSNEFCGNSRADYNFIYYRCSCPRGHLCVYTDKTLYTIEELFYRGLARRAHCIQFKPNNELDYDY